MGPRLRFWLVTVPTTAVSWLLWWNRVYWTALYAIAAVVFPVMVLTMLVLWLGFGIRWGW